MTDDDGAARSKLLAEDRALEVEHEDQDEFPEEIDVRLGDLEVAMEKLEVRPLIFDDEEIARAGAFVTLIAMASLPPIGALSGPRMCLGETQTSTAVNRG
jgi:ParB family chromosome partitioning protein